MLLSAIYTAHVLKFVPLSQFLQRFSDGSKVAVVMALNAEIFLGSGFTASCDKVDQKTPNCVSGICTCHDLRLIHELPSIASILQELCYVPHMLNQTLECHQQCNGPP